MTWMTTAMILVGAGIGISMAMAEVVPSTQQAGSVLDVTVQDAAGRPIKLEEYRGKVLLIVNVASRCGFTSQYDQLEQVYRKYQDQGFVVLGFPANDFGQQEPGTNQEIQKFCRKNYGVSFPVFGKLIAKGEGQSPLYQYLTSRDINGEFGGQIGWNFTKFLISRGGKVVARYESPVKPDDPKVTGAIEAELARDR